MTFSALLISCAGAFAMPQNASTLPGEWIGKWVGNTHVLHANGERKHEARMEINVAPTSTPATWTWTMTYGEGPSKQVRPYSLIGLKGKGLGAFDLDEHNGIVLPTSVADGVMWSAFKVGPVLLQSRYQLSGDTMITEISTFRLTNATKAKAGELDVEGYEFASVQRATLKRVKERRQDLKSRFSVH